MCKQTQQPHRKPETNMSAKHLHQFLPPQAKQEDAQGHTFRDHCTRSVHYLRTLSFSYMQSSEHHSKPQAKPRFLFDDHGAEDSEDEFEFSSTESNPTNGNVLFCGRIIRQRQPIQQEQRTNMSVQSPTIARKLPYERSVSNCSTPSGRQSQKTLIGTFSFKAETGMSMREMKKRQKQRERPVPLFPTTTAAGTDEIESAIAAGGDHQAKTQVGLVQRMKPKGNLVCGLAKALLPL